MFVDDPFHFLGYFVKWMFAFCLEQMSRQSLQGKGSWIFYFINTMSDPHDFRLRFELGLNVGADVFYRTDLTKHLERLLVSSTVERTGECPDRRRDHSVRISER